MRDHNGATIILANTEEPSCIEDLSPRDKVEYFIHGLVDNAKDLVTFRHDPELAPFVAANERQIWDALNALQLVVSSIMAEHALREAERRRNIFLVK